MYLGGALGVSRGLGAATGGSHALIKEVMENHGLQKLSRFKRNISV